MLQSSIEMLSTDLVSELRAEVTAWWERIQEAHRQRQKEYDAEKAASSSSSSVLTPILGAMLGDGPIRMITLGQELTTEMDEKSLADCMFKESQVW
jgi:ubiquitin carboxyl-terminal hydrolase 34